MNTHIRNRMLDPREATVASAGHHIVRQMEAQGVAQVFCVPGESYLDVLDGLHDSVISTVVCRHEGGAGMMALAQARLTGRAGVAMVTRGPGAANAMVAIHNAWQDGTPLVLLVGLISTEDRGREAFQDFCLSAWFGSTAKKVFTLDNPRDANRVISAAFECAESGRRGPVVVGLPENVITDQVSSFLVVPPKIARVLPDEADLSWLFGEIQKAETPLIVAGGEDWSQESARRLAILAESLSVPVLTDFRAADLIDNRSPAYVGMLGYGRSPEARELLDRSDLMVFLGTPRTDVLSDGFSAGTNARTIVISSAYEVDRHFGRLDSYFQVSPTSFLVAFERLLAITPKLEASLARQERLSRARNAFEGYSDPSKGKESSGFLNRVFAIINEEMSDSAIVTYGAGNYALWPQKYLKSRTYPSLLAPKNGSMGFGIPAAVAAAIACPERQVLAFAGDGCFLMNSQELAVAAGLGLRLTVFVMDNESYGTIRQHQERDYPGRVIGTQLTNPDFSSLGEAYGAVGYSISALDDFEDVVRSAMNQKTGIALIHVRMDTGPM